MPNDKTFNLYFANVNRVKGKPRFADNNIVYVEYDIKAKGIKQESCKSYLYYCVDMVGLKDLMTQFKDLKLCENHSRMSVNVIWVKFNTLLKGLFHQK